MSLFRKLQQHPETGKLRSHRLAHDVSTGSSVRPTCAPSARTLQECFGTRQREMVPWIQTGLLRPSFSIFLSPVSSLTNWKINVKLKRLLAVNSLILPLISAALLLHTFPLFLVLQAVGLDPVFTARSLSSCLHNSALTSLSGWIGCFYISTMKSLPPGPSQVPSPVPWPGVIVPRDGCQSFAFMRRFSGVRASHLAQLVKNLPAVKETQFSSIPGLGRSPGEGIGYPLQYTWASLVAQMVKNLPAMQETWVQFLGWEDPLEEGLATHSSILAWRIPWTEEPGGLQSRGCQESDTTEQLSAAQHSTWLHSC